MNINTICKTLEQRFDERITQAAHLENVPLPEAILLGATMICAAVRDGVNAIDALTAAVAGGAPQNFTADKPSDAALHAALSGAGAPNASNPMVEVRAYPADAVPIASVVQAPPAR